MEQTFTLAKAGPNRWILLFIVLASYLMGFIIRFAWPSLSPLASVDLNINSSESGSYLSAFYIGYVIMHIPAGVLADRFGVRFLITLALILEGAATIMLGVSYSFWAGFIWRILAGLGAGALFAAAMICINNWFAAHERGIAFGLMMVAPTGGGVFLPNIIMPRLSALTGWRGSFIVLGITAILLAITVFLFLKDKKNKKIEKNSNFVDGLKYVFSQRNLILVSIAGWGLLWGMVAFISLSNGYVKHLGHSIDDAGIVMACFGVGGIAGPLLAGKITNSNFSPRMLMQLCCILLIPAVIIFGTLLHQLPVLMAAAFFIGLFFGLANPPLLVLVSKFSAKEWVGTASGVAGCIFQSASIFSPIAVGKAFDLTNKFTASFVLMALGLALSIIMLLAVKSK